MLLVIPLLLSRQQIGSSSSVCACVCVCVCEWGEGEREEDGEREDGAGENESWGGTVLGVDRGLEGRQRSIGFGKEQV